MDYAEDDTVGEECQELPRRLFALDHYLNQTKINAYSKPEYLAVISDALKGTNEMKFLLVSPFCKLFQIPSNKSSFSGKLVLGFVCRQVVTKKRHEMWMVFAGQPIKFGLKEFSIITGLECGKYQKKKDIKTVVEVKEGCQSFWDTLFGKDERPTIMELVERLKRDKTMIPWKRLAISLIIIVDGVLTRYTQPVRPSEKTVEMTMNLDFFCKYPWGRLSFLPTLEMISGFTNEKDVEDLVGSCKQMSLATHGIPLALQLLIFQTIPSLAKLIPDEEEENIFTQRSIQNLAKIRPIRTSNILECEAAKDVCTMKMY